MKPILFAFLGIGMLSFAMTTINYRTPASRSSYTSYWPNGQKKAEGKVSWNMRTGKWKLWDSTGKLVMERKYSDGFTWQLTYPKDVEPVSSTAWIDIVKGNYFTYRKIRPDSVIHSRRVWRYAPYDKSSPLFTNNIVLDTLISMFDRQEIRVGDDDEMRMIYSRAEFYQKLEQTDHRELLGYRMKEDWYYDYDKQSGIFALVSICPVMKGKEQDSLDLGWIVFDDVVQARLATMSFVPRHRSDYPDTYHEMFLQRCYRSTVYKYTNVGNRSLVELFPDPVKRRMEEQAVEREYFEAEHDYWLAYYSKFTPQKKPGK